MHALAPNSKRPALVVVTATSMEMQAALATRRLHLPLGNAWSTLDMPKMTLILLVSGVGPINAGIALGYLLGNLPRPIGVLNLGIAGAFDLEKLPLGQCVLVRQEIWPEYGLLTPDGLDPQGIGLPLGTIQGVQVWDRLDLEPELNSQRMGFWGSGLPRATSLTVAGVSGTPERAASLLARYHADIENMEGFALAWACRRLEVPFVQVRAISNLVGSRKAEHWDLANAKRRLGEVTQALFKESYG
jgi:futalosine hydrolase